MPELDESGRMSISRLIFAPALITLAVTVLRLVGELQHWAKPWFSNAAGGGAAIIGIVWLGFIFGGYFAVKLLSAGETPAAAKGVLLSILGMVLVIGGAFFAFGSRSYVKMVLGFLLMILAIALQFIPWPSLAKTLVAYAYAARIPVAVVMYFALRGHWGTHYDATPPNYPSNVSFLHKYVMIGLLPQLIFWVAFTVATGALVGSIVALVRRRVPQASAQPV
jgi:hypothetical protein